MKLNEDDRISASDLIIAVQFAVILTSFKTSKNLKKKKKKSMCRGGGGGLGLNKYKTKCNQNHKTVFIEKMYNSGTILH